MIWSSFMEILHEYYTKITSQYSLYELELAIIDKTNNVTTEQNKQTFYNR